MTSGVDPLTAEQRRRNMSAIRGKDTKPEMIVRRALHAAGLRYRLHGNLPGKPDLVFPGRRAVIFVHGCFWHGHDCPMFKLPATRQDFWREKIERNQARDVRDQATLLSAGWRVLTVWECALRGRAKRKQDNVAAAIRVWLAGGEPSAQIGGRW
ncbi:very short patch repair endonuclease [uncultured Caulobacter sp.]|uniref:very short patch repair endonuclease n=1 Tax=uncultured Caulobacter sp. TaxID=158749 RepID=UPI002608A5FB|nr:very short patch repair endonuclease [uncultured Caulobacter sp.]